MKTIGEVSRLSGVSVRALRLYDEKGLLHPTWVKESGYRLYDDAALERLQEILFLRELDFSLQEIRTMVDDPHFDRQAALEQHIALLTMKRDRLQGLIDLAAQLQTNGGNRMSFSAFDDSKIQEYRRQAKERWGETEAYREYAQKEHSQAEEKVLADGLMRIFARFGALRGNEPAGEEAQKLVQELTDYITANYYHCTKQILAGLGAMYAAGGEMGENIDHAGGEGTAAFAAEAIAAYCK